MDPVRVPSIPAATFPLPPRLEGLRRLAYNLHWAWHPRTRGLFSPIDRTAWTRYRNPIPVISGPTEWSRLLDDAKFLAEYHDVLAEFDGYMANGADHWFQRRYADQLTGPIAYFCAEYGFHESLGIYSGGLGVLAGDHMKSASDMALPAIGVGLLYRKGYFRQSIDADGHQEHDYPDYDLTRLPLGRVQDASGLPLTVSIELPGRDLSVAVWVAQVGRVPVLLLDTDLPENADSDRPITNILYVRGREMRLHQELVLGIGGVRAIRALGLAPSVWHLNEGHSAFLLAERAREHVAAGQEARGRLADGPRATACSPSTPRSRPATSASMRTSSGGSPGRCSTTAASRSSASSSSGSASTGTTTQFDMTAFSLRLTNGANAVSHLHAETANETWSGRGRSADPGHHQRHPRPDLDRRAGRRAARGPRGGPRRPRRQHREPAGSGNALERIPARDLWEAHLRQKRELAHFARGRLRSQFARHGEAPTVLAELETALDPDVLTIGFARRFATYKRAGLLFSDIDRLARMLWDEERPDPGRVRRQGPPGRPTRPAGHPGDLPALALAPAPRPGLHPRGLRHAGRRASSCRASTSGSTTRAGRSRRPGRPA